MFYRKIYNYDLSNSLHRICAITRINQYWLFVAPFYIFLISCIKPIWNYALLNLWPTLKLEIATAIKMHRLLIVFSKNKHMVVDHYMMWKWKWNLHTDKNIKSVLKKSVYFLWYFRVLIARFSLLLLSPIYFYFHRVYWVDLSSEIDLHDNDWIYRNYSIQSRDDPNQEYAYERGIETIDNTKDSAVTICSYLLTGDRHEFWFPLLTISTSIFLISERWDLFIVSDLVKSVASILHLRDKRG